MQDIMSFDDPHIEDELWGDDDVINVGNAAENDSGDPVYLN